MRKSYRLGRQEEAPQILFPPHHHHFRFHQSGAARRRFSHQLNKKYIGYSRRNQAAVRLLDIEMEFP